MTTLELIEKHGIGHNCLSDAYELGRRDAIAEISREMRMLYGNEYERQIKADAIKEVLNLKHYAFKADDDNMYIRVSDIKKLKEQK